MSPERSGPKVAGDAGAIPTSPLAMAPSPFGTTGGEGDLTLGLVRRLCDALVREGIPYCHWKSNDVIDRSAAGDSDLDLLVDERHQRRFAETIHALGFKDGRMPTKEPLPGVFHTFGLDAATGKLVHLHVHHRLVVGDDMTKNYWLPIEQAYLSSTEQGPVFRLPTPTFEFVVFVLRMVLKHSTWDAILWGRGSLSPSEVRELGSLLPRTDDEQARSVVREHLPFIGLDLWERCRHCLRPTTRNVAFRIVTAHRLERSLAQGARRSPRLDPFVRIGRRAAHGFRRRVVKLDPVRARLGSGGALIALVGGDGAGKSTAVEEVRRWLSKDLDVVTVHLGKPPRSLTSAVVNTVWRRGVRRVADASVNSEATAEGLAEDQLGGRGLVKLIRRVLISRDRSIAYLRARRAADRGTIVISDRFPLPQVTLMDGPATTGIARRRPRNVPLRLLASLENRSYGRIHEPDILIVLRVDPEVAVQRRSGTESEGSVRQRAAEIWDLDWSGLNAVVIDAGAPKDRVLAEIRSAIWARL